MWRAVVLLGFLIALAPRASARAEGASDPASNIVPVRAWIYADVPLWDFADEGLPFRVTLALPSRRDPVARLLLAAETRWSFSVGYAKVYNSYDGATGVFKNPGGHAALFSAGRQFWWALPERLDHALVPRLMIEFGVNCATRPFPADGTRATLKLITAVEWKLPRGEWTLGVAWPHFSNANLFDRNAGYDGLTLRVGRAVSW